MTVYNPTHDDIYTGVRFNLTTGDSLILAAPRTIGSTNTTTITDTGSATGSSAQIAGTVLGLSTANTVQVAGTAVTVTETGLVTSNAAYGGGAVVLNGSASLANAGTVTAAVGFGVIAGGNATQVTNTGLVEGFGGAVFLGLLGASGHRLDNGGTLTAGLVIDTDLRIGHAVHVEGDNAVVTNTGSITALAQGKAGIHLGAPVFGIFALGAQIANGGSISAAQGWGVDAGDNGACGITLDNAGTITGGTGAVRGSGGADVVDNTGTLQGNVLLGGGNDRLTNGGTVTGNVDLGTGNDRFDGRGGTLSGTLQAGDGNDVVLGGAASDSVQGGAGNDKLQGQDGDDTLDGGAGKDSLNGGNGNDALTGGDGLDTLTGAAGDDVLDGGTGNDLLSGGSGNDAADGGSGSDTLQGGTGRDTLTGGTGGDTFVFATAAEIGNGQSRDQITDFTHGQDVIDLTGFMTGGSFIGSGTFGGIAGEVRHVTATGLLQGDTDGDGRTDWSLWLANVPATLDADDFAF